MILLTGTVATSVPFEVKVLPPRVFNNNEDLSSYVMDHFNRVLQERAVCTSACLGAQWKVGIHFPSKDPLGGTSYSVYAERDQGIVTYHLRSEALHIVYRLDNVSVSSGDINVSTARSASEVIGPDTLYWNPTPHPAVRIALMMSLVSGYAANKVSTGINLPKTYEEVSKIVPDDDPVTTMIIVYAMLKANDKYALFHVQDGSLYLYTDQGYLSLDGTVQGFEDGVMCDADRLYAFSPMYRDVPYTIDSAVQTFFGMSKQELSPTSEKEFHTLLTEAFSPGLTWKEKIPKMLNLLQIDASDIDTASLLMRIIAKHKLLKGANTIFSQFPCSIPNERSP